MKPPQRHGATGKSPVTPAPKRYVVFELPGLAQALLPAKILVKVTLSPAPGALDAVVRVILEGKSDSCAQPPEAP